MIYTLSSSTSFCDKLAQQWLAEKKDNVWEYDLFRKIDKLSYPATVAAWISGKTMEAQKRHVFIMTNIELGLIILREYGALIKKEDEKT